MQRILNNEERGHPKIQCILNNAHSSSTEQSLKSTGQRADQNAGIAVAHNQKTGLLKAAPGLDELQLAATFMAGRYDQPGSG